MSRNSPLRAALEVGALCDTATLGKASDQDDGGTGYPMEVALLAVDHEMLRVSIRPFTALPVTIAYRGHFREISPGQSYEFRLIKPRGERSSCAPAQVDTGTKG